MSICVLVCLSASRTQKNTHPNFTKFFVQFAYDHDPVLFWWRCDTLCTSSFADTSCFHIMAHRVFISVDRTRRA